jgi:hypothetical protein
MADILGYGAGKSNNPWARLGPLQGEPGSDFIFHFDVQKNAVTHLAPNQFRRVYAANYAPVSIALSDHAPREFHNTNATELTIEFEIVGDGQRDVENSLAKLRKFMRKDRRTSEPPDMVFVMGQKQWTVRIDRMEHTPRLWNPNTGEQRVHVMIQMHTLEWEK